MRSALTVGPTPHAVQAISECYRARRPIVIVSNNSAAAIQAFLDRHELSRALVEAELVDELELAPPIGSTIACMTGIAASQRKAE